MSGLSHLYATWVGRQELHAWCARERARLRAGVDFDGLVLLLGRFVHVGGAVDLLFKDIEAAREFAAVDPVGLLMPELPEGFGRERAEQVIAKVQPDVISHGVVGPNYLTIRDELPDFHGPATRWSDAPETFHRISYLLVMAANCLDGLDRLVRRFTPKAEQEHRPAERRT